MADAEPHIVWTIQPNGDRDYFNRRCYEYTGMQPGESDDCGWQMDLHPDDLERTPCIRTQSLETGEPYQIEYRLRRHDGIYRWFLGRSTPVRNVEGRIVKWVGTCTDIEEQKRAQDALRITEQRFRSLVYATSAIDWTTNPIGEIVEITPRWQEFTGQTWSEYRGFGWMNAVHPEDRPRVKALWGAPSRNKASYEAEYRLRHHDGVYRWVWARGIPILGPDGNIREWGGASIDIHNLVMAREALENERSTLRTALDTIPAAVFITDLKGRLTFVNKKVDQAWGSPLPVADSLAARVEYKGWWPDSGEPIKPEDWPLAQAALKGKTSIGKVVNIQRFDGRPGTILINATPIRDAEGHVTGALAINLDITEQRKAQEALTLTEERYRAMVIATGALTWMTNPEGEVVEDSPSWRKYTGQSYEELKGNGWLQALKPEDRSQTAETWKVALSRGKSYQGEYRLRGVDGNYRWFIACGEPVRDSKGTIREWVGTSTNIDPLKRATGRMEVEVQKRTSELKESRERLAEAQRIARIGSWEWDIRTNQITWSDEEYRLFGLEPRSIPIKYTTVLEKVYSEDIPLHHHVIQRALQNHEPYEYDHRVLHPDGTLLTLHVIGTVIVGETGQPIRLVGTSQDVTGVRKIERALRESEARFKSAFEFAAVGMAICSFEGRYLEVNPVLTRILGTQEELLQTGFSSLTYPEDRGEDNDRWHELWEERIPYYNVEKRYICKDGRISSQLVKDEQGIPLYAVRIIEDITDRKRAEVELVYRAKEIERQRDFAQKIIEHIPAQIAYLDRDLIYRISNPAGDRTMGVGPLLGRHLYEALPDAEEAMGPMIQKVLDSGKPEWISGMRFSRQLEGKQVEQYFDYALIPILDDQGQAAGLLVLGQDVTARIERERLQSEQVETLRQADRVKDDFLSVISHELRTPLNAVIGFGSFLQDEIAGPLNPDQSEYIEKLMKGADRMLVLIDDLLDFARMQAGKFGVSPGETDFPSLVGETLASFYPSAAEKRIRLSSEIKVEQPICLDRRRIQQVIANLLSNAIKFTPEDGWVHVRSWLDNGILVTEVSDNGIGIVSEDLPKLFTPFKQLDMGLTRRARGVGLGLSISKAIVVAHGGSIEAQSKLGNGSAFTFRIPIGCTSEGPLI